MALFFAAPFLLSAQKYFTRNANVNFDATNNSSPEEIKAKTSTGTIVLEASTGAVEAAVLMKSFQFEKALMGEHFNENYVESSKYPKAVFKGKLADASAVKFDRDGTYKINAVGTLTMHGNSKQVTVPTIFTVKDGKITAQTDFTVALADFNIDIPSIVADKVAKNVKITFVGALEALK